MGNRGTLIKHWNIQVFSDYGCVQNVYDFYTLTYYLCITYLLILYIITHLKGEDYILHHLNQVSNSYFHENLGLEKIENYINSNCHLKYSSLCMSPLPKSSSFWVSLLFLPSLLPKSRTFCVSPLPGTTKARPRKQGHAKQAGFEKRGHPKKGCI